MIKSNVANNLKYKLNKSYLLSSIDDNVNIIELSLDENTKNFINKCYNRSWLYFVKNSIIRPFLSWFISHTNLNALLATGEMFLLSSQHFKTLLQLNNFNILNKQLDLLDIGAGNGLITKEITNDITFNSITTTDISKAMTNRQKDLGFNSYNIDNIDHLPLNHTYDIITIFNVFDRCNKPIDLLLSISKRLKSNDSLCIITIPLPLSPSYEDGKKWLKPQQSILQEKEKSEKEEYCYHCDDNINKYEEQIIQIYYQFFIKYNYKVISISRIPYLSQGDLNQAIYILDDVLFIIQKKNKKL